MSDGPEAGSPSPSVTQVQGQGQGQGMTGQKSNGEEYGSLSQRGGIPLEALNGKENCGRVCTL